MRGARDRTSSTKARRQTLRAFVVVLALAPVASAADWQTKAEATAYRETSTYDETVAYCRRLDAASPEVAYREFGRSADGRALPLLVLSRDRAFTPEAARRTGKPVVLVQNAIHAGEVDGKEASLALARDVAVTRTRAALLDSAVLLVVPIYNADGHERSSPYNRINQNGPAEMGWRATSQNLNLNRDYMKADAPETRAMLALMTAWQPDLFVDTHVTDGADFQYDLLYTIDASGYVARPVAEYVERVFEPRVRPAVTRAGHVVESYFVMRDSADPTKGIERVAFPPRFSHVYGALRNRPSILVETHMLKSFEVRVRATYDLLVAALEEVNRDPAAIRRATREADAEAAALGAAYDAARRMPLRLAVGASSRPMRFRGVEFRLEASEVSGGQRVVYGTAPRDVEVPLFDAFETSAGVAPPIAYVVPAAWSEVVERLEAHGVRTERLAREVTGEFETYRLEEARWGPAPYEGRHPARFTARPVVERRTLPAGSVLVRLDQPLSKVAVHLLEPAAPDSLAAWGFFDAIFEQKEYAEGYVLEALARRMLAADPELAREYEALLSSDKAFRESPEARLEFFYRRSPYRDARIGAYPVVRLTRPLP